MAWTAGAVLTAAQLNLYAPQEWTAYTPALTALTTNPTLGNSTLTGKWARFGKLYHFRISLTIGSTFTAGSGAYFLSLPMSSVFGIETGVGQAVSVAGATRRGYIADLASATTLLLIRGADDTLLDHTGAGAAWAAGHKVGVLGTCEVA